MFGDFVGQQPPSLPNVYKALQIKEAADLGFKEAGEYLRFKAYFDLNGGHEILPVRQMTHASFTQFFKWKVPRKSPGIYPDSPQEGHGTPDGRISRFLSGSTL